MKRYSIYIYIACLFLAACSSEADWLPNEQTPEPENGKVNVLLNLQVPTFTVEETRSSSPLDLQIENPMYNLWLLHYNGEGGLVEEDTKYIHLNDKGELATQYRAKLTLKNGDKKGTICLIANLEKTSSSNPANVKNPSNDKSTWPQTFQLLQQELLTLPINQTAGDASLGLPTKMIMYGYYQGELNTSYPVNITLGRMAARLDIIIGAAKPSETFKNLTLQLKNAVIKTHYSPMKITNDEATSYYVDFPVDYTFSTENITSSHKITCYYFTGENITPEIDKETTLVVTAKKNYKTYTYNIKLGANAPGTSDDYSLYRNNNYTFNINLN